jgi:hypothetical protein
MTNDVSNSSHSGPIHLLNLSERKHEKQKERAAHKSLTNKCLPQGCVDGAAKPVAARAPLEYVDVVAAVFFCSLPQVSPFRCHHHSGRELPRLLVGLRATRLQPRGHWTLKLLHRLNSNGFVCTKCKMASVAGAYWLKYVTLQVVTLVLFIPWLVSALLFALGE